ERLGDRQDGVIRVVERGPQEIVHRRVDGDERLGVGRLVVEHAREQRAGVADDRAPGLQQYRDAELLERGQQHRGVLGVGRRRLVAIADAETATYVDGRDLDAPLAQLLDERGHAGHRVAQW